MSAQLGKINGRVLTITVSGTLTQPELLKSQSAAGNAIDNIGKVRILLVLENFKGTASDGDWGDFSFQMKYDPFIERIAIVSPTEWMDAALLFTGKGIRPIQIKHFTPNQMQLAEEWADAE